MKVDIKIESPLTKINDRLAQLRKEKQAINDRIELLEAHKNLIMADDYRKVYIYDKSWGDTPKVRY